MGETKDNFEALMGGVKLQVLLQDGKTEEIAVRQLPIRLFPELMGCLNDEVKQAALYCDRDEKWAGTLTPQSHELVIAEGERLNKDFFSRWVERRKGRQDYMVKPDVTEAAAMLEAVARANPKLLSDLIGGQVASSNGAAPAAGPISRSGSPRSAPAAG